MGWQLRFPVSVLSGVGLCRPMTVSEVPASECQLRGSCDPDMVVSETWSFWWFAPNWWDEIPAPEMRIDHGVRGGSLFPMWERRGDQTRQDRHRWTALSMSQ